ncbi:MAG: RlmE family RNA methyltransferase [Alphaproteobacteria bacterium]|nr:RlmE family RNA methyltransferase [Alphaproteobacteria bacterium]
MSEPPEKRRWTGPRAEATSSGRGDGKTERARKVKTESSKKWIERQLNDPYVRRAKAEGWRARAAFKLLELDEKFGLLKKGQRVVDLGVAPGGWAQVVIKRGASAVVGVDLLAVDPIPGVTLLQMDFLDEDAAAAVMAVLGGSPDLVLSDMAANTTGHVRTDQIKTGALAEAAARFAMDVLAPGGAFVTKAFQGGLDAGLLSDLKKEFATVKHAKPPASRQESPEVYVVAQGFRAGRV